MKLTVLADNYTYIDRYYFGEPALSFYIEDGTERILFDTGYSDVFIKNAEKLGVDLSSLTMIVFSHGHNDHTGGLPYLWNAQDLSGVKLLAHPDVFAYREYEGLSVGAPFTREEVFTHGMKWIDGSRPYRVSEHLLFLGPVPRVTGFEANEPIGIVKTADGTAADYVSDDTALVYEGNEGLFIITGCSHSGICNIIEYAKACTGCSTVTGVIGGFHLMKRDRQLEETVRYLKKEVTGPLYPCHCVSLYAKHRMLSEMKVIETGTGMELEIPDRT